MSDLQPMPKEIAGAVMLVMRAVGRLVNDAKNQHGGYSYASTDAFYAAINPACAEAGLIIKPRLLKSEIVNVEVYDKNNKSTVSKRMLDSTYGFLLIHESGATWTDPLDNQHIVLDHNGPQTFGAAQSYAHKAFMRALFIVSTNEKDADADEQHSAEIIRATVKAVKAKRESGESQILIDFGGGIETVPAADVADRVMANMVAIGDATDAAEWWASQKHGRESFFNEHPRLAHELKKKVEAFLATASREAAQ